MAVGVSACVVSFTEYLKRAKEGQEGFYRKWMIVTCLVSAVACYSLFPHAALTTLSALKDLYLIGITQNFNVWRLSWCFARLSYATALAGFVLPTIQVIYQRGMDLLKRAEWKQMKDYLTIPDKKRTFSFFERYFLTISLIDTKNLLPHFEDLPVYEKSAVMCFFEGERQIFLQTIQKQLDHYMTFVPYASYAYLFTASKDLFSSTLFLTANEKVKYLPSLVKIRFTEPQSLTTEEKIEYRRHIDTMFDGLGLTKACDYKVEDSAKTAKQISENWDDFLKPINDELNIEAIEKINKKIEELERTDKADLHLIDFRKEQTAIYEELMNRVQIEVINKRIQQWLKDVNSTIVELEIYGKENELLPRLRDIQKTFFKSELLKTIQLLTSKHSAAQETKIDPNEDTWVYFSMDWDIFERFTNVLIGSISNNNENLSEPELLGKALDLYKISTMGDFMEKVLKQDEDLLKKPDQFIEKLKKYIEDCKSQDSLYLTLAGHVKKKSADVLDFTTFAIYRAVMIVGAVAPIVTCPVEFIVGATAALVFSILSCIPQTRNWVQMQRQGRLNVSYIRVAHNFTSRRTLSDLLSLEVTREMALYRSASAAGKCRILSIELFFSLLMMIVPVPDPRAQSSVLGYTRIGPVVQGAVMMEDLLAFPGRQWRRLRQHFSRSS